MAVAQVGRLNATGKFRPLVVTGFTGAFAGADGQPATKQLVAMAVQVVLVK